MAGRGGAGCGGAAGFGSVGGGSSAAAGASAEPNVSTDAASAAVARRCLTFIVLPLRRRTRHPQRSKNRFSFSVYRRSAAGAPARRGLPGQRRFGVFVDVSRRATMVPAVLTNLVGEQRK